MTISKIKSGNNKISNLKHLIPIILSGEADEIISYYPNLKDYIEQIQQKIKKDIEDLKEIYSNVITKESQKEFAIYLTKEIYTPFSCIFFNLRKEFGNNFTFKQVEDLFFKSEDLIIKFYKNSGLIKEEDNEEE